VIHDRNNIKLGHYGIMTFFITWTWAVSIFILSFDTYIYQP